MTWIPKKIVEAPSLSEVWDDDVDVKSEGSVMLNKGDTITWTHTYTQGNPCYKVLSSDAADIEVLRLYGTAPKGTQVDVELELFDCKGGRIIACSWPAGGRTWGHVANVFLVSEENDKLGNLKNKIIKGFRLKVTVKNKPLTFNGAMFNWEADDIEADPCCKTTAAAPKLKITVATDATWPPFEYVDETTKELVGFDIDLMNAIAEAADFEVEFINVAWDPLLAGMATGEYDAAISAMTITEERAKQWDFSEPYWSAGQLIAVRVDETGIKGPDDLVGRVVGAQIGTIGAMYIEDNIPGAMLETYDEISQAFLDLINGQIDAVVADDPLVEAMVKKYSDVIWVGGVLTAEELGIAVKKGAPEILEAINKGLKIVMEQGLIDQLKAKWIEIEAP